MINKYIILHGLRVLDLIYYNIHQHMVATANVMNSLRGYEEVLVVQQVGT